MVSISIPRSDLTSIVFSTSSAPPASTTGHWFVAPWYVSFIVYLRSPSR